MHRKVLAYLTRTHQGHTELLVLRRMNGEKQLLEVPGGNVGPNERPEEALYRQVEEETGLVHLKFNCLLLRDSYFHPARRQKQDRYFFHVESLENPPHQWQHTVQSFGGDNGETLELFWMPLMDAKQQLSFGQGRGILLLCCSADESLVGEDVISGRA